MSYYQYGAVKMKQKQGIAEASPTQSIPDVLAFCCILTTCVGARPRENKTHNLWEFFPAGKEATYYVSFHICMARMLLTASRPVCVCFFRSGYDLCCWYLPIRDNDCVCGRGAGGGRERESVLLCGRLQLQPGVEVDSRLFSSASWNTCMSFET